MLFASLRGTLGFSAVEYSYVVTSFLVAYGIGFLFCGAIIDRIGVKMAVVVALAGWSLAAMLHAAAGGWFALGVCRFLLGLGQSFSAPCGIKGVAEWIPNRERGLCTSIVSNGNTVGNVLAVPLVSWLALDYGWQWSFIVTGALGFVYLLLWFRYYDAPERQTRLGPEERSAIVAERGVTTVRAPISAWAALAQPACLGFMIARLFTDSLSFFFSFWLPE